MTRKTITKGRYSVTITVNGKSDFLAILTRDGRCLPGISARHYSTAKAAERGASSMFAKAGA